MDSKGTLLAAFQELRGALLTNDVDKLEQLIAKDYIGYDLHGNPQDLKITLEAYQPGCSDLDIYDIEDIDGRIIGDVGIITGKGYVHGTFAEYEFEHYLRFMDIYIFRNGSWQFYLSQVTPLPEK